MMDSEKAAFMQLWSAVIESYNRKPPSDSALMLVTLQLEDYSFAEIKRAIKAHGVDRNNDGFPPTTNDIARLIEGDGKSAGLEAFSKAMKAAGSVGAGASVCFDDPVINLVIEDMGGWIAFCMSDEMEMKTYKIHEFDKRYRARMNSIPDDYPRKLVGSEEAYNQINWPKRQNPLRLIGDRHKAIAVHERPVGLPAPSSQLYIAEEKPQPKLKAIESKAPASVADLAAVRERLQPSIDKEKAQAEQNEEQRQAAEIELQNMEIIEGGKQ